jgi:hypothetical protein
MLLNRVENLLCSGNKDVLKTLIAILKNQWLPALLGVLNPQELWGQGHLGEWCRLAPSGPVPPSWRLWDRQARDSGLGRGGNSMGQTM